MLIDDNVLTYEEKTVFALRSLYAGAGYASYTMNKFEPYDLYMRNKDFLLSDSVITFTDTNGQLMALKPDVTLSIAKNSRFESGAVRKVYYDEKVYRPAHGGGPFREIRQTGLEALGDIGPKELGEVLLLAEKTLSTVSSEWALDISCPVLLSMALDADGAQGETRQALLEAVGSKAFHALRGIAESSGLAGLPALTALLAVEGNAREAAADGRLDAFCALCPGAEDAVNSLKALLSGTDAKHTRLDFSVQSDLRYYSDIVFSGFAEGVPAPVLRGGRYDPLLRRLGKKGGAIGFALYLDLLEFSGREENEKC